MAFGAVHIYFAFYNWVYESVKSHFWYITQMVNHGGFSMRTWFSLFCIFFCPSSQHFVHRLFLNHLFVFFSCCYAIVVIYSSHVSKDDFRNNDDVKMMILADSRCDRWKLSKNGSQHLTKCSIMCHCIVKNYCSDILYYAIFLYV